MRLEQWLFWDSVLSEEWCDEFVKNVLDIYNAQEPKLMLSGENQGSDHNFRMCEIRWLAIDKEKVLVDLLMGYANMANRETFDINAKWINEIQFATYQGSELQEEQGKYGWHSDVDFKNPKPFHRKLTVAIQLSDPSDYTGGDFQFKPGIDQLPIEAKNKGTVLVFPSIYEHQLTPVTHGTRHSLVAWVEGPHWR